MTNTAESLEPARPTSAELEAREAALSARADIASRLEAVAGAARAATLERDRLVLELRGTGASLSTIAQAIGMTVPGVARIIKRGPAE